MIFQERWIIKMTTVLLPEEKTETVPFPAGSRRILVVDDDPDVLKILKCRLGAAGYEVILADSPTKGLEMAAEYRPDLAILDVVMPGTDGVALATSIRNEVETRDIPIMFLSGVLTDWGVDQGDCLLKNTVYMSKPYHPEKLLGKIEEMISNAR
jgi:DNA-binding response OmpR family regulator